MLNSPPSQFNPRCPHGSSHVTARLLQVDANDAGLPVIAAQKESAASQFVPCWKKHVSFTECDDGVNVLKYGLSSCALALKAACPVSFCSAKIVNRNTSASIAAHETSTTGSISFELTIFL